MENIENTKPAPVNSGEVPAVNPVDLNLLAGESHEILANLLRLLSFEVKLSSSVTQGSLRIQLLCEDPGRLIGRKGATVNELQFLLNRILQGHHEVVPRIYLDVAGPHEKEEEKEELKPVEQKPVEQKPDDKLVQRVKEIAAQVHRWGQPIDLGTLSVAERQIVQEVVAKDRELEAISLEPAADSSRSQKMQLRVKEKAGH